MQILQARRSNTKAAASLRFSVRTSSNWSWKSLWRISGARFIIWNRNYSGAKIYRVHLGGKKSRLRASGKTKGWWMAMERELRVSFVFWTLTRTPQPRDLVKSMSAVANEEKNSEFLTWEGDKRLTSGGELFLMMVESDQGLLWNWVATEQGWRNSIKHHLVEQED